MLNVFRQYPFLQSNAVMLAEWNAPQPASQTEISIRVFDLLVADPSTSLRLALLLIADYLLGKQVQDQHVRVDTGLV